MPLYQLEHDNIKKFFLFIHIPKTGGTSITQTFKALQLKEIYGHDVSFRKILKQAPQHLTYDVLNNLIKISKLDFSFAIIREPFDRIISSYVWSKSHSNIPENSKNMNFENWFNQHTEMYKHNINVLANHLIPQNLFIGPDIKKIYKFENGVYNIFKDVLKSLNIKITEDYKFPHAYKTSNTYQSEIKKIKESKQLSKMIYDFYKDDYDLYNQHFN